MTKKHTSPIYLSIKDFLVLNLALNAYRSKILQQDVENLIKILKDAKSILVSYR